MRTPEEILNSYYNGGYDLQLEVTLNPSVEIISMLIEEAQKEAWNEAILKAAKDAQPTKQNYKLYENAYVDKQSILKNLIK